MMPNVQDCEPNYHLKICLKTISNELSFTLLRWHYNITYNLFTFIDINKNTFFIYMDSLSYMQLLCLKDGHEIAITDNDMIYLCKDYEKWMI